MSWKEALWEELDQQDELEQIMTTAEWINDLTHVILPALAQRRRQMAIQAVSREGWDKARVAESVGTRIGVINRLVEEGRVLNRPKRPKGSDSDAEG